jgi:O-antigen ligase
MTEWIALATPFEGVAGELGLIRRAGLGLLCLSTVLLVVSALGSRIDRPVTGGIVGGVLFLVSSSVVFSNGTVREGVVTAATVALLSVSVAVVITSMNEIVNPADDR